MVAAAQVVVGVAAVQVAAATGAASRVTVTNRGTASVFLGGESNVTTAGGYELPAGATVQTVVEAGDELFAIAGTAGHNVHVLQT